MTKIYTNIMRKHSIALLLTATLLASCGGSRKGAVADNRYRRAPILEVTAEELSNDSALIDATAQMLVGKQEEAELLISDMDSIFTEIKANRFDGTKTIYF